MTAAVAPWPSAGTALIEARDVSVTLGTHHALVAVSAAAREGEIVALVGPNGAGKSTLLHVMAGDIDPHEGGVVLHGCPLHATARGEVARVRSVLPQQTAVAFPFTVTDVVRMGRAPWRGTPQHAEDDDAVADALLLADIAHLAGREVTSLSGGERARVAFARLLAQRAPLMLLDEPTAALDIAHQERLLRVVRDRVRAGGAAVIVMHDLGLAAAYADRVALISQGRLVACDAPTAVLRPEVLSAVYEHPLAVVPHPVTGSPIVVPMRSAGSLGAPRTPSGSPAGPAGPAVDQEIS